jgi:hypothetical protein
VSTYDNELSCPSIDVCAHCGDVYCDGIACIAELDPDDPKDQEAIELLQDWIRRGRVFEQAERFLAVQENRTVRRAVNTEEPTGG